jgi:hypothetical protein
MWDYQSGGLTEELRRGVESHLNYCRECEMYRVEVRSLRAGLRQLPLRRVPARLQKRLFGMARREHSRQMTKLTFSTWRVGVETRIRQFFDNLLKPFAVPAAGGLLTSFLCFGMILNTLHLPPEWDAEMPVGFSTEVMIDELTPFSFTGRDVMVKLTVDASGRVTNYEPQESHPTAEEMQEISNLVLYSTFTPATRFGKPVSSKRLFAIRHARQKS